MNWIFGKKKQETNNNKTLVAVYVTHTGIAIAALGDMKEGKTFVKAYRYQTTDDYLSTLKQFIQENHLESSYCSYVLLGKEYILTLIETPNVAPAEKDRALRWLLRESINFPINDAMMDSFELTEPRSRDNAKLSYVAIAKKQVIEKAESLIENSGLELKYIDIQECVLRNLAELHPEESNGILLAYLDTWGGKLIICRKGNLYTARTIDLKLDSLRGLNENVEVKFTLEQLSLEIQRSMDYASSTFRQNLVNSILIAPTALNASLIQSSLNTILGINVHTLDLMQYLKFNTPITPENQANCLIAIGALLRETKNNMINNTGNNIRINVGNSA